MWKAWLIVMVVLAGSGWALLRPMQHTVMPKLLRSGTEQMLAHWRDALLAYQKDEGQFPPADLKATADESRYAALCSATENKAHREYLTRFQVALDILIPIDAWETPLAFDPEHRGDQAHIVSAGPDLKMGTADDIDSRSVTNLHLTPETEGDSK